MPDEKRTAFGPIVCERCHVYPQLTDSNWCAQCAGKAEHVKEWPVTDDYAAAFRDSVRTTVILTAALRGAVDLLVELRDCPLSEMEQREAEIDAVVAEAERLLPPAE
jgi:hypothetical protein